MSYSHGELVQLAEEGGRKQMPRYIDANALTLKIDDWRVDLEETYGKNDEYVQCLESVLGMIEDAPTADVVEVVRCKDCEHCEEVDFGLWYCNSEDFQVAGSYTEADFYCGAGLPKCRKGEKDVE